MKLIAGKLTELTNIGDRYMFVISNPSNTMTFTTDDAIAMSVLDYCSVGTTVIRVIYDETTGKVDSITDER